jgi:DNA topoisomerase I
MVARNSCGMVSLEQSQEILARADVAAAAAGLRYVSDEDTAGIARHRHAGGFTYKDANGQTVKDKGTLLRIRKLAIPPAWTSVWISPIPNAHLAATGRDAKGRKQYRYNPDFVQVRDAAKYGHLIAFAESLPKIREAVSKHLSLPGMPREKVLASVIALLEQTLIRIGNEDYAKQNGSFGLTTLRGRHVQVVGSELRFLFPGKSGKTWRLSIRHRRVANVMRACQELPGQNLFQYRDEAGEVQRVSSSDVNEYLREASGCDISAKDFRTWAGTVEAAVALHALAGEPPLKKHVRAVLEQVAAKLGNTPTICRKCYIHPEIFAAYEQGRLTLRIRENGAKALALTAAERAVLNFLKAAA